MAVDERIGRLADPTTTLGMLQRGRGEGYLAALAMAPADAADLVWHCIVHDPRWDLQVETRAEYYATLASELDLELSRLRPERCPTPFDDVDQRLVISVLGDLAMLRSAEAGDVLLAHVAGGAEWDGAIWQISRIPGQRYAELPGVLETRFDENELASIVARWERELPWQEFASDHSWVSSGLAQNADRERSKSAASPFPEMTEPVEVLLAFSWPPVLPKRLLHRLTNRLQEGELDLLISSLGVDGIGQWVAFQALGRMNSPAGLEVAREILKADVSGPSRRAAMRYVRELGAEHTLGLARQWLNKPDGRGAAAQTVIELHAEPGDAPVLHPLLAESWEHRDFYGLCSYVTAFSRLPNEAPKELLEEIYEHAEYSYARRIAATTLASIDAARFDRKYGVAAAHDCEQGVRDLAPS